RPSSEERARLTEEVAATAEALIIGALGASEGALSDVLMGGATTTDAQAVLALVAGVDVAHRGSSELRPRAGQRGSGVGGVGDHAPTMASMAVATRDVRETAPRGHITVTGGGDVGGSGDFDPAIVSRTIRGRIRAIQRCYETQLGRNPTLAGTVRVRFTVTERGTVSGARTVENTTNDAALAACVAQRIGRLRFHPGPVGGSVDFAYPFVFAPQR
ncbi:MAG: AgmX/PglI C-terminal domain-containing protein, partial [Myxococcota bacterium]